MNSDGGIRAVFWLASLFVAIAILGAQSSPPENVIHVEIAGLRSDNGQLLCALHSSADGFPTKPEKAAAKTKSTITNHTANCDFIGVAAGTYAVSVVHDENSNGKLDRNFVGMPKEGVGASNNAKGHLGPPKFAAAKFQFAGNRLELRININYL